MKSHIIWLVVEPTPLKNHGVRQLGEIYSQDDGKVIKNLPNHQPGYRWVFLWFSYEITIFQWVSPVEISMKFHEHPPRTSPGFSAGIRGIHPSPSQKSRNQWVRLKSIGLWHWGC